VRKKLDLHIEPQPDDATCGPTCLHAVYSYWGERISLARVIDEIPMLETGGTLAAHLANHALRRGYTATIYTHNLVAFDPSWFGEPGADIAQKLREQMKVKSKRKLHHASEAYLEFLSLGGQLRMQDLDRELLRRYLRRRVPILTGLSATWLYRSKREVGETKMDYDDVRGEPQGHFVVVHGYDRKGRSVHIADPAPTNPLASSRRYQVGLDRLITAIHLGVLTYDSNLLILEPK